jgi:DNA-binding CsgD family transcriptional regulator
VASLGRTSRLNASDAVLVKRLVDLLERYRPSDRPVVDELIHELAPCLAADAAVAFRPVRGELGWTSDFVYCTDPSMPDTFRTFLRTAPDGWTPFFPVTPKRLRNRAVLTRVVHGRRLVKPNAATREFIKWIETIPRYLEKDDLGLSVCDGSVPLCWIGATRKAPFGPREVAIVDAIAPALMARMLLEHQLGYAKATRELLEAALEAVPTATFIIVGSSIDHANATGRALLDRQRTAVIDMLRESMVNCRADSPFAITPVDSPGVPTMALAVLRGGDSAADRLARRMLTFSSAHALSPRQGEVLSLLARGYGNKTIAERLRVSEGTVEEHVTGLFHKTGADSRAVLVAKFWSDSL